MAEPMDRPASRDPAPEAQWSPNSPETTAPYEEILSPTQAVWEALALLGRLAPAADVRDYLARRGIDVDEDLINRVRSQLPGSEKA